METRQYGDTICIHFFIRPFEIEGVIRKVKRAKKKTDSQISVENLLEHQKVLNMYEENKNLVRDMIRMQERF
ncbi:hypothetical protein [Roseburia sp. MSJ-14]|uniref:hypothetical protein n=1 Tax=Roseburia sp. MSJ-14 TaxID=2841514 RepID=UPI001C10B856|nr:hypothetical protein [Roseburia sp. MSJ-14]MBU5473868.1 hypothetical protein [Roseburia sp. MSJ-14]